MPQLQIGDPRLDLGRPELPELPVPDAVPVQHPGDVAAVLGGLAEQRDRADDRLDQVGLDAEGEHREDPADVLLDRDPHHLDLLGGVLGGEPRLLLQDAQQH